MRRAAASKLCGDPVELGRHQVVKDATLETERRPVEVVVLTRPSCSPPQPQAKSTW
jgi:hypothetical protein